MVDVVSHVIPKDQVFIEEAMPFKFDNLERIRKVSAPILLVHGKLDSVVPYAMGQQLERAVRSQLTRIDLSSAGHRDIFVKGGKELWTQVHEFLGSLSDPATDGNAQDLSARS